ncbi:MAG: hypothetical protein ACXVCY_00065 [Pseudobdellovibrionaceae bacterium]
MAFWINIIFFLITVSPRLTLAHKGLPIPLVSGSKTTFGEISISADPELGEGLFLILIQRKSDVQENEFSVQLVAQDKDRKQKTSLIFAKRDSTLDQHGNRIGFRAEVPFTHEGTWNVDIMVTQNSQQQTFSVPVEVTLPGPTKTEFFVFAMPFVLVALLLISKVIKRKHLSKL